MGGGSCGRGVQLQDVPVASGKNKSRAKLAEAAHRGQGTAAPQKRRQTLLSDKRCLFADRTPIMGDFKRNREGQKHKSKSNIFEGEIINCNLIT